MIMNNGPSTRSYSTVPVEAPKGKSVGDHKEHLKELVKARIAMEVTIALTYCDLASTYCKMGLPGHKHKMEYKSSKTYKKICKWKDYYYHLFHEMPHVVYHYETKDVTKSIDDIYNQIYDLHVKSKENLVEILAATEESHEYANMKMLFDAYAECEEHEAKLESRMRRVQSFGYDVANILEEDNRLLKEYEKCMAIKRKHHRERSESTD